MMNALTTYNFKVVTLLSKLCVTFGNLMLQSSYITYLPFQVYLTTNYKVNQKFHIFTPHAQ
jgi:hypothetical protein